MSVKRKVFYFFILLIVILAAYIFIPFKEIFREKPSFIYKKDNSIKAELEKYAPIPFPKAYFATLSDTHIYDTSLGTDGAAFQHYLDNDRKMLIQSEQILDSAMNDIIENKPQFVIISGDLTKDGEMIAHELFASKIARFKENGINVYVVPGNHDINNSDAVKFIGDKTEQIKSVNDKEFALNYADFGYNDAIYRDENSLSYIVEPIQGLWLFALDSVKWRENTLSTPPIVGGRFYKETLAWLESKLLEANRNGKAILITLHHGILEHYKGNKDFYPEYLIDDFALISEMFATYNARVVLTGHFHASDITGKSFKKNNLYDIETGSLVTAPSPYRFITLEGAQVQIQSKIVESIESIKDFQPFAREYTKQGLEVLAKNVMNDYYVSKEDQEYIAPFISEAFLAHYKGDETPLEDSKLLPESSKLGLFGKIVLQVKRDLILGIWHDLTPKDNNVVIDLDSKIESN